jgi:hypothetical protein
MTTDCGCVNTGSAPCVQQTLATIPIEQQAWTTSESFSLISDTDEMGAELAGIFMFALFLFAIAKAVRACFPRDSLIVLHLN